MRHPIDAAAAVALRALPRRLKTFRDGWGDEALHPLLDAAAMAPAAAPLELRWGPERHDGGLVVRDAVFDSPAAALPPPSSTGVVRRIGPAGTERAICVWMAAWNDHGYATRTRLAVPLARMGIASVLLENPYYGARRVGDGRTQPIATVADFAVMGHAAVTEGCALLATLRAGDVPLGVAGYSMGANIAAMVAAACGFPVATAALAASHSPGPVFLDGAPAGGVDWDALGGKVAARPRLRELLGRASVLSMTRPDRPDAAVIVGSRRDGFVPASATHALHRHWPGSELRWHRGGHATMLWFGTGRLGGAVDASFDRLAGRG